MTEEHRNPSAIESFTYAVNLATASLFYLLQGMKEVRSSELPLYNSVPENQKAHHCNFPKFPSKGLKPVLVGPEMNPNEFLAPNGEIEQLALQGWLEKVYNIIWDSQHRKNLKEELEGPGTIPPVIAPMGDLRRIRNDIVHKNGVSSKEGVGKCTVLKWFNPGDPIILEVRHVLDFLNQMGMISSNPVPIIARNRIGWMSHVCNEATLRNIHPTPQLISVRVSLVKGMENGGSFFGVSVVFENGVFQNIPVNYPADGKSPSERYDRMLTTCIDGNGDLRIPGAAFVDRATLYNQAIDVLYGKGVTQDLGPVPGPWYRFRE